MAAARSSELDAMRKNGRTTTWKEVGDYLPSTGHALCSSCLSPSYSIFITYPHDPTAYAINTSHPKHTNVTPRNGSMISIRKPGSRTIYQDIEDG